jgi:hypothetical protein
MVFFLTISVTLAMTFTGFYGTQSQQKLQAKPFPNVQKKVYGK